MQHGRQSVSMFDTERGFMADKEIRCVPPSEGPRHIKGTVKTEERGVNQPNGSIARPADPKGSGGSSATGGDKKK